MAKNPKPLSLAAAFQILGKRIVLQKSNSSVRKSRKLLTVNHVDKKWIPSAEWRISGGQCSHTVRLMVDRDLFNWTCNQCNTKNPMLNVMRVCSKCGCMSSFAEASNRDTLVCIDHEPTHKPTKPGQACSHISAVQLMLAQEIMKERIC